MKSKYTNLITARKKRRLRNLSNLERLFGLFLIGLLMLLPVSASAESILATPFMVPGGGVPGDVYLFKFEGTGPLTELVSIPQNQTDHPSYVEFNSMGELFVANYFGNNISRFIRDIDGNFKPSGTITGNGLSMVTGLAFSPSGELFAANYQTGLISRFTFDANGNAIEHGTIYNGDGGLNQGLAFGPKGDLFIADAGQNVRRVKFDNDGNVSSISYINIPDAVGYVGGLHGLAFNDKGELFTAAPWNNLVFRILFNDNDTYILNGNISVEGWPLGVAFSSVGELFVTTHSSGQIYRFLFDNNGEAISNGVIKPTTNLGGVAIFEFEVEPSVSISIDKSKYSPGDTMIITLNITNPKNNPVAFEWYIGVPQSNKWVTKAKASIPAGYSKTHTIPIPVGNWGPSPLGLVHYVQILDPTTKEVLAQDAAVFAYSPIAKNAPQVDIAEELMKQRVKLAN